MVARGGGDRGWAGRPAHPRSITAAVVGGRRAGGDPARACLRCPRIPLHRWPADHLEERPSWGGCVRFCMDPPTRRQDVQGFFFRLWTTAGAVGVLAGPCCDGGGGGRLRFPSSPVDKRAGADMTTRPDGALRLGRGGPLAALRRRAAKKLTFTGMRRRLDFLALRCSSSSATSKTDLQERTSACLRNSARRSRSVMPPHTPNSIRLSSASARHSSRTGQPRQIFFALFCSAPCTNSASGSPSWQSALVVQSISSPICMTSP